MWCYLSYKFSLILWNYEGECNLLNGHLVSTSPTKTFCNITKLTLYWNTIHLFLWKAKNKNERPLALWRSNSRVSFKFVRLSAFQYFLQLSVINNKPCLAQKKKNIFKMILLTGKLMFLRSNIFPNGLFIITASLSSE